MCTEMWDWRICRFIDNEVSDVDKVILQPLMFDMEKRDDNYYVNSRGQYEKHNIQYGERLTLLTEDLSEKIEEDSIKSEYIMYRNIPLLNDSLCFIVSKNNMINMMNYIYCGPDLLNIIISLLQYNSGNNVYLYYDVNVSLHQIISNKKNSFIYYSNYTYIVCNIIVFIITCIKYIFYFVPYFSIFWLLFICLLFQLFFNFFSIIF